MEEEMTAVFKNPLSETRRPRSVSFSSRSPLARGAFMSLNAVAEMELLTILWALSMVSKHTIPRHENHTHGMENVLPVRSSVTVSEFDPLPLFPAAVLATIFVGVG
jgi:hypothetical protein